MWNNALGIKNKLKKGNEGDEFDILFIRKKNDSEK